MKFLHSHYPFAMVDCESVLCLKMVSKTVGAGGSFQLESVVHGHHVYYASWTPSFGKILPVKREPANKYECLPVAVLKYGKVVGHVP